MMPRTLLVPVWKPAPFTRLLLPLAAGIVLQWNLQLPLALLLSSLGCVAVASLLFARLPQVLLFRWHWCRGLFIQLLFITAGMLLVWMKDSRHDTSWYGNYMGGESRLLVRLSQPPEEKARSYKAEAEVLCIMNDSVTVPATGKLLLYFAKDTNAAVLKSGDELIINKALQPIRNSGNPGAFNYRQYASFHQLFHTAFLSSGDWVKTTVNSAPAFQSFLFTARDKMLHILQQQVSQQKDTIGIAEALLIGYTQDLDKDLVQAYSNTGVVHIIAISGMHLALIYLMLVWLFKRLPLIRRSGAAQLLLVLTCLWLFSLLTGASASVLRSAVMFSFVAVGRHFGKSASIFNSLAVSAFVLLCYNPFYLWDVGFQLSYLAVLGIVIFQRPIYNLILAKNKWVDKLWQLAAVSLAAQLLTFPVCIFYFHQFPNLFLPVNMVVVPLSGLILYAEIALVCFSWIPFLGPLLGKLVGLLVGAMNFFIGKMNSLPGAVWDNIPATLFSTILLYAVVIFFASWLLTTNKRWLFTALGSTLAFLALHCFLELDTNRQERLIVYNVPRHRAIDIVRGAHYQFMGDSALQTDALLRNFHLKPARIFMRLDKEPTLLLAKDLDEQFFQFGKKRVAVIGPDQLPGEGSKPVTVDIIILTGNPKISISELQQVFSCRQYVFDAANSLWKIAKWKSECETLHLRCHSVPEEGAFILDL